uniref:Uncharacterized protein n=1 Tax=Daphnia galeata TaxID=27404 RepID=A0A8J2RDX2_9CRUS|nr:unnamed protein product [Daphnia galeata]
MADFRRFIEYGQLRRHWFVVISLSTIFILISSQFNHELTLQHLYVNQIKIKPISDSVKVSKNIQKDGPISYAVFCTTTPNGESYRSYDYAYNVPLTALAWERIGFKSIVLIIGSRCEWENDPTLSLILSRLEERSGIAIFVKTSLNYRSTISQMARIFVTNFKEFPGKESDYLITSDADLWPIRKEHFIPHSNMDIVLVHGECCGEFKMNNKFYSMYPMSNIGATVSIWRQLMNENHSIAYDSESILNYLQDVFGEISWSSDIVGRETWYMDQRLISIRIAEWMELHGQNSVYRVSDKGFSRADRASWAEVEKLSSEQFLSKFDSHLPRKGYLPKQQAKIKPLIDFMYGNNSLESKWIHKYNQEFLEKVNNWIEFNNLDY